LATDLPLALQRGRGACRSLRLRHGSPRDDALDNAADETPPPPPRADAVAEDSPPHRDLAPAEQHHVI